MQDFRSSKGLFSVGLKEIFEANTWNTQDGQAAALRLLAELKGVSEKKSPTPTHIVLSRLFKRGLIGRCYSQNIDGLEAKSMATWPDSVEGFRPPANAQTITSVLLHGTMDLVYCPKCWLVVPWTEEHTEAFSQGRSSDCSRCCE